MDWLEKLREAKDLLDGLADHGADLMRKVAIVVKKIADGIELGADVIDPTPGGPVTMAVAQVQAAEELLAECETILARPRAAAGGAWLVILMPLIIKFIEEFLRRRQAPAA